MLHRLKLLVLAMFFALGVNSLLAQNVSKPAPAPAAGAVASSITVEVEIEVPGETLTMGQVSTVVQKIGGDSVALGILRGHVKVYEPQRWYEDGKFIWAAVESDGIKGEKWGQELKNIGVKTDFWVEKMLNQKPGFDSVSAGYYSVVIIKGTDLFGDEGASIKEILKIGNKLGFEGLTPEFALLLRKHLTNGDLRQMGVNGLVTMHQPVYVSDEWNNTASGMLVSHTYDKEDTIALWGDGVYSNQLAFAFLASAKGRQPSSPTIVSSFETKKKVSKKSPATDQVEESGAAQEEEKKDRRRPPRQSAQ